MITVTITGWKSGLLTISLIKLVREFSGQDLSTAKHNVDALLQGTPFSLTFNESDKAERFSVQAQNLGAIISN
jgi:hypothetical protein